MVKLEELEKQIEDYIIDLILESDTEKDWDNKFYRDNITISADDNKFNVRFTSSGWLDYEFDIKVYNNRLKYIFNEEKRELNKKLLSKFNEIRYYIDNKSKLRKLNKIINNFPIKVKRKEKLKKLNSETE